MNYLVIGLGIVLVLLVYFLYKYITVTSSSLASNANLNNQTPVITTLQSPKNVSYAYGIWIYVNSWNSTASKYIFTRPNNIQVYLDRTSPILYCNIYMADNTWQTMTITNNFPIQKWTFITISVDNLFVDAYLDGKLIVSNKFITSANTGPATPPDIAGTTTSATTGYGVYLGNTDTTAVSTFTPFDALVSLFQRWSAPLDPQTVWNTYLQGNGQSGTTTLSSYGLNMTVLQNNVAQGTYAIL